MNVRKQEIEQCEAMLQEIRPQLQTTQKSIQKNRDLAEKHEYSKRELDERIGELESYEYPDSNEMDLLVSKRHPSLRSHFIQCFLRPVNFKSTRVKLPKSKRK